MIHAGTGGYAKRHPIFVSLRVALWMHARRWRHHATVALLAASLLLAACAPRPASPTSEIYVSGLNQPRGMAFDAAGNLYVAEAGASDPAAAEVIQPETNHSARVVRVDPSRAMTAVLDGLPYTRYITSGDVGATDVGLIGGVLYVLTGEGYDEKLSRRVLRVIPSAPPQSVASFGDFALDTMPLEYQLSPGGAPSNPYAMAVAPDGGALYVTDGASGRVLRAALDGKISLFAELPDLPPLAGLAFGPDSKLYFTMFSTLPHAPGSGEIWSADPAGQLSRAAAGLTMPIDVAFDASGAMYVLEFGDGRQANQPYAGGSGRLLRVERDASRTIVLDQLDHPTAMAFAPSGDLYIAVGGAFSAPGQGAILRVQCAVLSTPERCASTTRKR
jgi:sugar lactone lactonase YvrE